MGNRLCTQIKFTDQGAPGTEPSLDDVDGVTVVAAVDVGDAVATALGASAATVALAANAVGEIAEGVADTMMALAEQGPVATTVLTPEEVEAGLTIEDVDMQLRQKALERAAAQLDADAGTEADADADAAAADVDTDAGAADADVVVHAVADAADAGSVVHADAAGASAPKKRFKFLKPMGVMDMLDNLAKQMMRSDDYANFPHQKKLERTFSALYGKENGRNDYLKRIAKMNMDSKRREFSTAELVWMYTLLREARNDKVGRALQASDVTNSASLGNLIRVLMYTPEE